tara:strand:+ start:3868 stop:4581 length:714 start_codon:yes stop_codon:yes gene_type:complete
MKFKIGHEVKWRAKSKPQKPGEIQKVERKHIKKTRKRYKQSTARYGYMKYDVDDKGQYIMEEYECETVDGWEYTVKWPDGSTSEKISGRRLVYNGKLSKKPKNKQIDIYFDLTNGDQMVTQENRWQRGGTQALCGLPVFGYQGVPSARLIKYPNFEFNGTIKFTGKVNQYQRNLRLLEFEVVSGDLEETPLMVGAKVAFNSDLFESIILKSTIVNGEITGCWEFVSKNGKISLDVAE